MRELAGPRRRLRGCDANAVRSRGRTEAWYGGKGPGARTCAPTEATSPFGCVGVGKTIGLEKKVLHFTLVGVPHANCHGGGVNQIQGMSNSSNSWSMAIHGCTRS